MTQDGLLRWALRTDREKENARIRAAYNDKPPYSYFELQGNPPTSGRYLLLHFEWVGLRKDKPAKPQWDIRYWDGTHWERQRYYSDTGGYEEFEPVKWQLLPPIE